MIVTVLLKPEGMDFTLLSPRFFQFQGGNTSHLSLLNATIVLPMKLGKNWFENSKIYGVSPFKFEILLREWFSAQVTNKHLRIFIGSLKAFEHLIILSIWSKPVIQHSIMASLGIDIFQHSPPSNSHFNDHKTNTQGSSEVSQLLFMLWLYSVDWFSCWWW